MPDRSASCADDARSALPLAPPLVVGAHRFERANSSLVPRPPGLDALSDPRLLLGQLLVEEFLLSGFGARELVAAFEECGIVASPIVEMPTVELDDPCREPFEKHPVVGNEDERAAIAQEECLEPADRVDIQVVGRLVQEKDVGFRHEGLG